MKKVVNVLTVFALSIMMFTACEKNEKADMLEDDFKYEEADLFLKGDGEFEKVVTNPLVKLDDCKYIVAGTIEFLKDGELVAVFDFGDGTCDNIVTKTVDGETTEINLDKLHKGDKKFDYKKVVIEPLVKIEGCDYIVSGIIKLYKGDKWIVTIDFGDGECDEWATKTWDGGNKEFSLRK